MFINENKKYMLPIKDWKDYFVVADFDRTITNGNSQTSWSILANSNLVPKEYVEERAKLYSKYRPIELDNSLEYDEKSKLIREWFKKHIELFVKYKISEDIFIKASKDLKIMGFRKGAKAFLDFLYSKKIPLIIISAGIGNFIELFLKHNNCMYDNIYISSNKIIFKDGVANGVDSNIIHSLNKNEVSLPKEVLAKLQNREKVILLGDQVSDLKMVDKSLHKEVLTVGFATGEAQVEQLKSCFDVVCEGQDDYKSLFQILNGIESKW